MRALPGRLLGCLLVLPFTGCWCGPQVPPAPEDVDGKFHWLWVNGEPADDATLEDAVASLDGKLDVASVASGTPVRGKLTDLTRDELTPVGLENGPDPKQARGTYLVNVIPCDLSKLESLFVSADQAAMYPDSWDGYVRTYSSDQNAYLAGTTDTVGWDNAVNGHILAAKYVEEQRGTLRRLLVKGSPERLFSRTWMKVPATFEGTGTSYPQNEQVEVFYERAPGEVVHLYAMWREVRIDVLGLSTNDDVIINAMVDTLVKWDGHTAELCAMP